MKRKFILNEDIDEYGEITGEITPEELPLELDVPVVEEEPTEAQENLGITNMLSNLIKDEWEAIDGYNSTIATLRDLGGNEELIKVLEDIAAEEMVHVGELEKAMETVSPSAKQIEDGKDEAEETMGEVEPMEESLTMPVREKQTLKESKKHNHKKLTESVFDDSDYDDYEKYWMEMVYSEVDYMRNEFLEDPTHYNSDDVECKIAQLNEGGIENLCAVCVDDLFNSEYLWEQINNRVIDSIFDNINDVCEDDANIQNKPTELNPEDIKPEE